MSNVDILNEYFNSSECINLDAQVAWFKLVEEKFTSTNRPSAEISALIAELYSNKPADRMYSREEVISYLKRAETSLVG